LKGGPNGLAYTMDWQPIDRGQLRCSVDKYDLNGTGADVQPVDDWNE